jgi:hypothetical protein
MPDVKAAVMRLFDDDPEGYTKPLDTAFSVQIIVEELHYQHSAERLCADSARRHVRPRARSPSSSSATRAVRTTTTSSAAVAAVLRAVTMALRWSETAPLACGSWRACV